MLGRDVGELLSERALSRADDLSMGRNAVRLGDGGCVRERGAECLELAVEVRIERKLLRDDQRRDEYDVRPAVGRQAAGEIERVLRLVLVEQRHDDAPVGDRARPPGVPPRAAVEDTDVGQSHRTSG